MENIIIKAQHNCSSDRMQYSGKFIPILHEYVMIVRKDSPVLIPILRTLAKSIMDASWGEVRRQLSYKTMWYGKELIIVDKFFPSSQICHCCGARNPATKDLSVRYWVCPVCGASHDRDINAAKNILDEGIRQIGLSA